MLDPLYTLFPSPRAEALRESLISGLWRSVPLRHTLGELNSYLNHINEDTERCLELCMDDYESRQQLEICYYLADCLLSHFDFDAVNCSAILKC